jgi:DNA helicase INO80
MRVFADLVMRLHAEKHRCLVFCQMTRMIDILEDFMTWKKMSYFKMDGSTSI